MQWLFVLVEGRDDERFVEAAVVPLIQSSYWIQIIHYSKQKRVKTRSVVHSARRMGACIVVIGDIDNAVCITARRQKLKDDFGLEHLQCVFLAVPEIESWYLAGLSDNSCEELGLDPVGDTSGVTKEVLLSMLPKRYASEIHFKSEVLNRFEWSEALARNPSVAYFHEKCSLFGSRAEGT